MRKNGTIVLQFLTALVFCLVAVLNFMGGRWIMGILFLGLTILYLSLGVFYYKNLKR